MADELEASQQKQAYEAIRAGIVFATYKPSVRLPVRALCEELSLGRTPVREAIVRLQQEGLARSVPHSGTYPAFIDLAAAENARYVRKNLETAVAAECSQAMGEASVARLDASLVAQREAASRRDARDFFEGEGLFYRELFEAVGKGDIWTWIDGLSVSLDRVRWLSMRTEKFDWEGVLAQRTAVRDAICAHDVTAVCQLETQYLNELLACTDTVTARFGEYFAPKA